MHGMLMHGLTNTEREFYDKGTEKLIYLYNTCPNVAETYVEK